MRDTGTRLALPRSKWYDGRKDVVASTRRDLGGRLFVRLKDGKRTELPVSRAYAHLFRQM